MILKDVVVIISITVFQVIYINIFIYEYTFILLIELDLSSKYNKFTLSITILRIALRQYDCASSFFNLEEFIKANDQDDIDIQLIKCCEEYILTNLYNILENINVFENEDLSSDYCSPEKKLLNVDIEEINDLNNSKTTPIILHSKVEVKDYNIDNIDIDEDDKSDYVAYVENGIYKSERSTGKISNNYNEKLFLSEKSVSSSNITNSYNTNYSSRISSKDLNISSQGSQGDLSFHRSSNRSRAVNTTKTQNTEKIDKFLKKTLTKKRCKSTKNKIYQFSPSSHTTKKKSKTTFYPEVTLSFLL